MRAVGGLLAPYARPHTRTIAAGLSVTLLLVVLRVLQPWPLKWVIDSVAGAPQPPLTPGSAAVAFLLIAVAAARTDYAQVMMLTGLGNRILNQLRYDLFTHVLRQPLSFHERKAEGEILTRIIYDTNRLRIGLNYLLVRLAQTVLLFLFILIALFWVEPALALVLLVAGVLAFAVMTGGGYRVRKAARRNRKREGRLAALVAQELVAVRELQAFRPNLEESPAFARLNAKSLKQESKLRRISATMLLRVETIISIGIALVLLFGTQRALEGAISPGDLVLFASYATALYQPFFRFARQSAKMGSTIASADRVGKLLRRGPGITDAPDAVDAVRVRGEIQLRDIGVRNAGRSRRTRKWALRKVTLSVHAGDRVAVIGANGAGKSTLLRLLLRLVQHEEGAFALDGRPVEQYTAASLRQQMSVVFQGSVLLGATVRENLVLGRPEATDEELWQALRLACGDKLVQRLPQGLDTPLHTRGAQLSAGERQRLALSRAFLRNGAIWLLDEPTTGLDAKTSATLTAVLERATRNRTTFWITHDPRVATMLEHVLFLVDGEVRFWGDRNAYRRWSTSNDNDITRESTAES